MVISEQLWQTLGNQFKGFDSAGTGSIISLSD